MQMELGFPILAEEEVRELLNPDSPKCPFHTYVGNRVAVEEILDLAYDAFQQHGSLIASVAECCLRTCGKRIRLQGPPSVGKTTLARLFANILQLSYAETEPDCV